MDNWLIAVLALCVPPTLMGFLLLSPRLDDWARRGREDR